MKQLLLAHRDLAFAAAQACQNANTSIVVQNKCRAAAQTCREELFQAQRVLGNLGQVAKSVLQRQPDLHLGVMEKSTDMCQAFFRDFDKWVEEIKVRRQFDRFCDSGVAVAARLYLNILIGGYTYVILSVIAGQSWRNGCFNSQDSSERPRCGRHFRHHQSHEGCGKHRLWSPKFPKSIEPSRRP